VRNLFIRFLILGYGKNYTALLDRDYPPGSVRFSAIMQYSLLLWMNAFAIMKITSNFIPSPEVGYAIDSFGVEGMERFFEIGLVVLMPFFVAYLTRNYRGEYNMIGEEEVNMKFFVRFYPYFVFILFLISFII
jgi:hypothetical protein